MRPAIVGIAVPTARPGAPRHRDQSVNRRLSLTQKGTTPCPRLSKQTASIVEDFGVAEDRHDDLDGYTVNFVTIRQDHDLAPMLSGLPGGNCPCPHWGYVFKGRLTIRYGDHEETVEAGEAFYMPPGHAPAAEAGTEFVQFSPAEQMAATTDAIKKAMAQNA